MGFPECKVYRSTERMLQSQDFRTRYKAMRQVSSRFIKRKDVREAVLRRCNYKCYLCGSDENLQVDHVISVYKGAKDRMSYKAINSEENLMAICRTCNAGKKVE